MTMMKSKTTSSSSQYYSRSQILNGAQKCVMLLIIIYVANIWMIQRYGISHVFSQMEESIAESSSISTRRSSTTKNGGGGARKLSNATGVRRIANDHSKGAANDESVLKPQHSLRQKQQKEKEQSQHEQQQPQQQASQDDKSDNKKGPIVLEEDDLTYMQTNKNLQILGPNRLNWYKQYIPELKTEWQMEDDPTTMFDWCVLEDPQNPSPPSLPSGASAVGILYMKSYKASSSTLEGININIAHAVAKRLHPSTTTTASDPCCTHYNRHEFGDLRHHVRRADPSLLWTMVREPGRRDLSHIYHFEVGRNGKNATDRYLVNMMEYKIKGRQTRYLVKSRGKNPLWPRHELQKDPDSVVKILRDQIMENYDFIGVVERMEESLAVLTLLWNLEASDVIVLSAKRSGGYDDAGGDEGQCVKIPKAVRTPILDRYLSNKHIAFNADVLLYHAVNASLDATIDMIGKSKVEDRANEIRCLQALAQERCQDEAKFPCSATGEVQLELAEKSCYVQDAGCGHECVARELAQQSSCGQQ